MYYFISFASEDKEAKESIRKILLDNDIKHWVDDSEIVLAEKIDNKINKAIADSTAAIVIISRNYFKTKGLNSWCKYELRTILEKAKQTHYMILPIFLEAIDEIKNVLNTEEMELLSEISKYHGIKLFEEKNGSKRVEEFLIEQDKDNNSFFEDESGYYCYWGTEYGNQGQLGKVYNYLNIDTVHADKGRNYVVIGKFELFSQEKQDETYNQNYYKIALKYLQEYINMEKHKFQIIFSDKSVIRKEFNIRKENEHISMRFTGRVNGIYPFNMNIAINYSEIILHI